jgi:predicted DNA-binding transcriptional regulator AlpA
MKSLPETGFLRLHQIIGDPLATPPVPPLIPVKKSCWWAGVKTGRFPPAVKLGPRVTVWRVEDIRALISSASGHSVSANASKAEGK